MYQSKGCATSSASQAPHLYVSSASAEMASPSSSVSDATRVACQLLPSFLMTNVKATITPAPYILSAARGPHSMNNTHSTIPGLFARQLAFELRASLPRTVCLRWAAAQGMTHPILNVIGTPSLRAHDWASEHFLSCKQTVASQPWSRKRPELAGVIKHIFTVLAEWSPYCPDSSRAAGPTT
jgi:hypothetical protein